MKEQVVWDAKENGPRVLLRESAGRTYVVIQDRFGHYVSVSPGHAAQVASGIDLAVERVGRDGRIARAE